MIHSHQSLTRTILFVLVLLVTAPVARAEDSLTIQGDTITTQNVAETDWAVSTAGKGNSFNSNFQNCASHALTKSSTSVVATRTNRPQRHRTTRTVRMREKKVLIICLRDWLGGSYVDF